ncbi:putative peptide zinc metalloprotease protein [Streptacidiphilus sp. MAP12-16]|uniref:metalloprotease n=1 Tax=Streptacidiphilus sp. MAP12-16 TaxID=3156300 RepID=UPI003511BEC0
MSVPEMLQGRPQLRPDILVSRPLTRGPARIHLLLDPQTGARMEVAAKVHFVMDRLDGVRTLDEIGDDYAAQYGVRLGEPQWRQLLGLLYGRRLLVGTAHGTMPEQTERPRSSLLEGRIELVPDTPALIDRLHRATGFARRPLFLALLLLLLVAQLAGIAAHLPALAASAASLRHEPPALLAVAAAVWVSMALHELAHGLVGRAAGGRVTEIGVRWRLPMAYLYCEVENVRFFPRRRHQVATAGAGVLANLALLLPVYFVWLLLGEPTRTHPVLGALLLIGAGAGLVNLLPLSPLDGYKILEFLLGTAQLATESRRFAVLAASRLVRRGPGVGTYPARLRLVYGGYALGSTVLTGALLAVLGLFCRQLVPGGYAWFAGILPLLVLTGILAFRTWRTTRTTTTGGTRKSGKK